MRLAVALLLVYSTAHASPAAQLFDEARRLKDAGKIDEACARFANSWQQEKAIGTQLNLADCKEREGRLLEAWQMFDEAARISEQQGNATRGTFARNRAAAIEPRLSMLEIRLGDHIAPGTVVIVDGREVTATSVIRERLEPATVWVRATAPSGKTFARLVDARAGTVVVEVPSLAVTREVRRRSRLWIAGGTALVGIAGLIVGGQLAANAEYERNSIDNCTATKADTYLCPNLAAAAAAEERVARADRFESAATLALGGSAVAIAAAAVIWYTAPKEHVLVAPTATTTSVGVAVATQF